MNVLVYGHRGWIGGLLTQLLDARGVKWVGGKARCDCRDAVVAELASVQPTRVVMLIGRTHGVIDGRVWPTIDYLEQPGKAAENVRDNYLAPRTVIEACAEAGIHCTYLGTGCIFSYNDIHPCPSDQLQVLERELGGVDDDAIPTFAGSSYSAVKGLLDRSLSESKHLDKCLALRLRMPITDQAERRNFVTKIVGYERICSIQNSMSDLPSLLPLMVAMMDGYDGPLTNAGPMVRGNRGAAGSTRGRGGGRKRVDGKESVYSAKHARKVGGRL